MADQEQHTPGPWGLSVDNPGKHWLIVQAETQGPIAATPDRTQNDAANARRIVACVNACEGLDTAALEEAPLGHITAELASLRRREPAS